MWRLLALDADVDGLRAMRRLTALLPLCFLSMSACSPALNWRSVQVAQADGLQALFPCKPLADERQVAWPGLGAASSMLTMRLMACQAQERTWSLRYMTVPSDVLPGAVMQEWIASTRQNLSATARAAPPSTRVEAEDLGPISVPHMTPMPQAHAWRFQLRRVDGAGHPTDTTLVTWHFSHGLTLFQASVSGQSDAAQAQSSEDVAEAFFRSFHFPG